MKTVYKIKHQLILENPKAAKIIDIRPIKHNYGVVQRRCMSFINIGIPYTSYFFVSTKMINREILFGNYYISASKLKIL